MLVIHGKQAQLSPGSCRAAGLLTGPGAINISEHKPSHALQVQILFQILPWDVILPLWPSSSRHLVFSV